MPRLLRGVILLIGGVIVVVLSSCSNDASSTSAAPSTRTSAASPAGHVPPPPKVGQCRNTPSGPLESDRPPGARVGKGDDPGDWVDQTPVIDCSKAHTLETVAVIKPVELTLALVKQLAGSCAQSEGVNYLGISSPSVRNLHFAVYWPSPAQRAAGQSWVRCDVGVRAMTACCQLAAQTGSLRSDVGSDPVRFYMCVDQVPDPNRSQPLTSCKKPHRGELLPATIEADVTHYPSTAILNKNGRSGCAKLTVHRDDRADLVITPFWRPFKADWSGGPLTGFCFIHRKTGLMPPVR